MNAKIKSASIYVVNLPFKKAFSHSLYSRMMSDSVFVKVCLEGGISGYGESLPRKYVTGHNPIETSQAILDECFNKLQGHEFSSLEDARTCIDQGCSLDGPAKCAMELALLDAAGKFYGRPVSSILGGDKRDRIFYSGVMSGGSCGKALVDAMKFRFYGFKQVKVKVGYENDIQRLSIIRKVLGRKVDIRVDANCAWTAGEAIEKIDMMRKFGVSAIEQPVAKDDIEGLKKVTNAVDETIVADESLCTIEDAKRLSDEKACNMFNIRLSKCGGLLNSMKISEIARSSGIRIQLGCQVGESGVLSAAGRHFACALKDIEYAEGSYGRFLLKEDVTVEDITFGRRGMSMELRGPGLGVNVSDEIIDKYTVKNFTV